MSWAHTFSSLTGRVHSRKHEVSGKSPTLWAEAAKNPRRLQHVVVGGGGAGAQGDKAPQALKEQSFPVCLSGRPAPYVGTCWECGTAGARAEGAVRDREGGRCSPTPCFRGCPWGVCSKRRQLRPPRSPRLWGRAEARSLPWHLGPRTLGWSRIHLIKDCLSERRGGSECTALGRSPYFPKCERGSQLSMHARKGCAFFHPACGGCTSRWL